MTTHSSPRWQRPTVWFLFLALLLVAGGSWMAVRQVMQSRQAAEQAAAEPPPKQVKVAALGRIEPASRVLDVASSETGRISRLVVVEGDTVQAEQPLAYLDIYKVRQAERDYAASQLAEAQAQLQAETAVGQARIREAATRVEQIDQPQQAAIAAQAAAIESLQADLNVAEIDLKRFQQLYSNGAISRQELDRQQASVDRLRGELENAQATKLRLEQSRKNDMTNAQAQVQSAQANLSLSQIQSRVQSAAQNLALKEAQLALAVIKAPEAGQILKIYADPGESVSPNSEPIMALGDTDQMYVVAEVYETDVGLVKVGQSATITSRNGAFDQTLTGTVEQIGLQIYKNDILDDDPAANADARVVEVRIRIDQSQVVAALTNLQVDVAIDINDQPAAVVTE